MSPWSLSVSDAPSPGAAVEIAADHVAAAVAGSRAGRPFLAAHAIVPLPEGALVASLTAQNARDRAVVEDAVSRALESVGRPRRVALVVPDLVTKVSLVRFEHVPSRRQDLDQLVRWQVRKAAPFPTEEAQVSWVEGARTGEGQEFVVSIARTEIIREYEAICAAAGAYAGIVDIATFNVINAVLAGAPPSSGDWLLVQVSSDYTSVAILRGTSLIFFRSRSADAEGTLADLVHQTAMYYEDRLTGGGFTCVLLGGAAAGESRQAAEADRIRQNLQERLGKPVETVGARIPIEIAGSGAGNAALAGALAPLVGVLLRGREVIA